MVNPKYDEDEGVLAVNVVILGILEVSLDAVLDDIVVSTVADWIKHSKN